MVAALEHLKVTDLTKEEKDAAAECERQLATLKFIPSNNGYDFCDDPRLGNVSEAFYKTFNPWLKMGGKNIIFQAFRFNKSAILPVSGLALFIPTITTGNPTISDQGLKVGTYVQLTEDVLVKSGVYCLAFRSN